MMPGQPLALLVWGAGGHAKVVADALWRTPGIEIVGFLDDIHPQRVGEPFCNSSVVGGRQAMQRFLAEGVGHLIVAVGDCRARIRLAKEAKEIGFTLLSALHPSAVIAEDVHPECGAFVAAGVVINSGARIGENTIVNTAATVDHDCILEEGVHLGPGVHLGGRARIQRLAWVGIGAVVADGCKVGEGSIVGAGSVVLEDIPSFVVAYGVPAKVRRRIE